MDWTELGERVRTLYVSISQQLLTTKKASEKIAPAQATMLRVCLQELLKHKKDAVLAAVDEDFPNEMTVGDAKAVLDQMYRYWKDEFERVEVIQPDW